MLGERKRLGKRVKALDNDRFGQLWQIMDTRQVVIRKLSGTGRMKRPGLLLEVALLASFKTGLTVYASLVLRIYFHAIVTND